MGFLISITTMESNMSIPFKSTNRPVISVLGIYPRDVKSLYWREACSPAVLFGHRLLWLTRWLPVLPSLRRIWPNVEKSWATCSANHSTVLTPITSSNNDSYLGHFGTGYSSQYCGTILGNFFCCTASINHKPSSAFEGTVGKYFFGGIDGWSEHFIFTDSEKKTQLSPVISYGVFKNLNKSCNKQTSIHKALNSLNILPCEILAMTPRHQSSSWG